MAATEVKVLKDTVRELLGKGLVHQAIDALIAGGHGYHVTIGAFSTGILGGGALTILDQDQPEGVLSIGGNQAMIPVSITVQAETPLVAADDDEAEILIAVDRTSGVAGISGGGTQEEVFNMRTDLGGSETGPIQAWSAVTVNITNPTLGIELARKITVAEIAGVAANTLWGELSLNYEPKHPPILVGAADGLALYLYWGGTVAVNGYAQVEVVVFPASWVKNLD